MDEPGAEPRSVEHIDDARRLREADRSKRKSDGFEGAQLHPTHVRVQCGEQVVSSVRARDGGKGRVIGEERLKHRVTPMIHPDETVIEIGVVGCGHSVEETIQPRMMLRGSDPQQLSQRADRRPSAGRRIKRICKREIGH